MEEREASSCTLCLVVFPCLHSEGREGRGTQKEKERRFLTSSLHRGNDGERKGGTGSEWQVESHCGLL